MINRSISEFSLAPSPASLLFSAFSLRSSAPSAPASTPTRSGRCLFSSHRLPVPHGASTFLSGNSAPNCQFSAINDKSANIPLRLSIILSNIVGAPTFWSAAARRRFCGCSSVAIWIVLRETVASQKREQAPALQRAPGWPLQRRKSGAAPCPVRRVNVTHWGSTVPRGARRLVRGKAY